MPGLLTKSNRTGSFIVIQYDDAKREIDFKILLRDNLFTVKLYRNQYLYYEYYESTICFK